MKTEIKIEFYCQFPGGQVKTYVGKIVVDHNQKLRRKLYSYCNQISQKQLLKRYNRKIPIDIGLKNNDLKDYSQPFYLNKNGRVVPLSAPGLLHDWTYQELLDIKYAGLSKGIDDTIVIKAPVYGLGGLGGGSDGILCQMIIGIATGVVANIISADYKTALDTIRRKIYIKRHRNKISDTLFKEIITRKNKWNLDKINRLFYFTDKESEFLLRKFKYRKNNKDEWARNK